MKLFVLLKAPRAAPQSDALLPGLEPADRAALGTALHLAAEHTAEVVALSAGPPQEEEALRTALRLGAQRAIRIYDPSLHGGDLRTVSAMLAAAIRHLGYDLVLAGNRSSEWATGAIGPCVAHFLGVPHVTRAMNVEWQEGQLALRTQRAERVYACRLSLPAVVAVTASTTEHLLAESSESPRAVETLDLGDLTLPFRYVDAGARPIVEPIDTGAAQLLDGAADLLQILRPRR